MTIVRTLIIVAVFAGLGHFAAIFATPRVIMAVALNRASAEGAHVNAFLHAPRITEQSRRIVRPSPDLAYSTCVYDLARGPVRIRAAPGGPYVSLSLYDAQTNNFFVRNGQAAPGAAIDILVVSPGAVVATPVGANRVESTSRRGLALVRRLAPTAEAFAAAEAIRAGDVCAAY